MMRGLGAEPRGIQIRTWTLSSEEILGSKRRLLGLLILRRGIGAVPTESWDARLLIRVSLLLRECWKVRQRSLFRNWQLSNSYWEDLCYRLYHTESTGRWNLINLMWFCMIRLWLWYNLICERLSNTNLAWTWLFRLIFKTLRYICRSLFPYILIRLCSRVSFLLILPLLLLRLQLIINRSNLFGVGVEGTRWGEVLAESWIRFSIRRCCRGQLIKAT
jgi:hypothetical protein